MDTLLTVSGFPENCTMIVQHCTQIRDAFPVYLTLQPFVLKNRFS